MFKSQMKCQKILCFVCLILAALMFVYALGFITSFYEILSFTVDKDIGYDYEKVKNVLFYWELQTVIRTEEREVLDEYDNVIGTETVEVREPGFVDKFIVVAIIDVGVALLLFITRTNRRRKYYISNYVATTIFAGYNIGATAWMLARITYFKQKYMMIDRQELQAFCESRQKVLNLDMPVITVHLGYVLGAFVLIAAVAVVLNLIWKVMLEKRENKLLQQSSI